MKYLKITFWFISFIGCLWLQSCQNDEDMIPFDQSSDNQLCNVQQLSYISEDSIYSPKVIKALQDAETYDIETLDDLIVPMQNANSVFKEALANGLVGNDEPAKQLLARVSISKHTEYEVNPLVLPEDIHMKMYFKSKFSATVVNKINAVVSPEYRISTGTTYCCYWDVFYHDVLLEPTQKFGYVESLHCALHPETRNAYIERGYAMEKKEENDGRVRYQMYSFQLRILYKDTNKKTIYLGITYPRALDSSPWNGYEFSYNILSM